MVTIRGCTQCAVVALQLHTTTVDDDDDTQLLYSAQATTQFKYGISTFKLKIAAETTRDDKLILQRWLFNDDTR